MKLVSTALLAAGMLALSACGGAAEENVAANDTADDLYNVAPDDLTLDNGLGNDLGTDLGNGTETNLVDTNVVDTTANATNTQ